MQGFAPRHCLVKTAQQGDTGNPHNSLLYLASKVFSVFPQKTPQSAFFHLIHTTDVVVTSPTNTLILLEKNLLVVSRPRNNNSGYNPRQGMGPSSCGQSIWPPPDSAQEMSDGIRFTCFGSFGVARFIIGGGSGPLILHIRGGPFLVIYIKIGVFWCTNGNAWGGGRGVKKALKRAKNGLFSLVENKSI